MGAREFDPPASGDRGGGVGRRHAWLFALFLCHELDAMVRAEWRLLPVLRSMPDEAARDAFNLLHVPLVGVPIWLLVSFGEPVRRRTIAVLEWLLIVHAAAHALLRGAEAYQFEPPVETITVFGAAAAAALHRVLDAVRP